MQKSHLMKTFLTIILLSNLIPQVAFTKDNYPSIEVLLSASETTIGQTINYQAGQQAKITAAIVTMAPGKETGWHLHNAPLFGYMLEGELTVDYGPDGR